MYTIMLIDDEDEVREGIKRKTNWAACGFQMVGDYDNGRDALDAIERMQPDVVITDICMPFMDGLQLTERVAAQYRTTKVVIVTGYEDFDYAKQAIRLKVKDYLLKPINSAEFTEFLQKLRQELDEERAQRENITFLRHQFQENLPHLRERFLERMVTTGLRREEIASKLPMLGLKLGVESEEGTQAHVLLALEIDAFGRESYQDQAAEEELLRFAAYNIWHEIVEGEQGGVVFRTRDDKLVGLVTSEPARVEVVSQMLAEQVLSCIEKYLGMRVSIGISRSYASLQDLPKAYQEALTSLDYRFLLGQHRIIAIGDMEFGRSLDHTAYVRVEKRLIAAIKTGEKDVIPPTLRDWMEGMKTAGCSVEACYGKLHKLLVALMQAGVETGLAEDAVLSDHAFTELYSRKTLDAVREWLEAVCLAFVERIAENRMHASNAQLQAAIAYIHEHYADEELSLQQVCNHIYMSMSYFSALFKPHTGETFIEYVTRYRLERAKELLLTTTLKTYELAAQVGYGDPQYFSVIFKRHTGMTPKEFRAGGKIGQRL
ncbi:response regulator [Paenibacillus whitsoniae]|uniref:Response regulator n=1 Tax=Paenibacillus whitsoniae TaxID=2496558 RepID=A0A3R9ZZQ9_9BACL|nr:response regulator [Paenibacillus whitsoniae]RTE02244.1 response regulator [Paenibacillus whitsoniae]